MQFGLNASHQISCSSGNTRDVTNKCHPLHGHSRDPVAHLSLGHLHSIALCLYSCSHGHLGVGWEGHDGCGAHPPPWLACNWSGSPFPVPTRTCWPKSGSHQQDLVQSWVSWSTLDHSPRAPPTSMCEVASSLSLQGSDLPSEKMTSTFFFCILINTEEAGAVYLGETSELVYLVLWNLLLLSIHD